MRKLVLAGLVAMSAAWTGLWFYAAHETGRRLETWQRAEADQGRNWTCPDRVIDGFPFAIKVACTDATYVGRGRDGTATGSVARVAAAIDIVHPRTLVIALTSPFSFRAPNGTTVGATSADATRVDATRVDATRVDATRVDAIWSRLTLAVSDLPDAATVVIRGDDVSVEGGSADGGRQSAKAASLSGRFARAGQGDAATLAFDVTVAGTSAAPLDALLGDEQPTAFQLVGHLDRASLESTPTPQGLIEEWRRAGGTLALSTAHLSHGESAVTASGTLHLDDGHRPAGHLEAQFVGLGPVLRRFGISPGLAAAGSILASLFGGGGRHAPAGPGAISMPIDLRGGHLAVGPITTPVALPALY